MPKHQYIKYRINKKTMKILDQANAIIEEYAAMGLVMSLRQVYYQFIARGLAPNQKSFYKNLSYLLTRARMTGIVDWLAIEDMTRFLRERPHFDNPLDAMEWLTEYYGQDLWTDQKKRFEVWLEKDSLMGTVAKVCRDLDVGYFACRGYSSASELWKASRRLLSYPQEPQDVTVIHMGDFDPTGLDATRDIKDKLDIFTYGGVNVIRIALTKAQIRKYKPPPFDAKVRDSRYDAYVQEHGHTCWELDSLPPDKLAGLVRDTITPHINKSKMKKQKQLQEDNRARLELVTEHEEQWPSLPEVQKLLQARTYFRTKVSALRKEAREHSRQEETSARGISRLQRKVKSLEQEKDKLKKAVKKAKAAAAKKRARSKSKKKKSK